jgi:hypothetical protein
MTLGRRERRTAIGGQFAPRLIEMLESPAYRVLSVSAHRILARIEIELAHHGGTDNGRLPITYQNFQDYGMDRDAIAPAIRECQALGFVEITEHGRGGNAEFRAPNLFRLTYRHGKGIVGDGTHEWRRIETIEQALAIAREARKTPPKKQNSNRGKPHVSVGGIPIENGNPHPGKPRLQSHSRKTPTTLDISGGVGGRGPDGARIGDGAG